MKQIFPALFFGAVLLFSATPSSGQHAGGGHVGGGHFGGFSSHGSSHSFGRIFGGHSNARGKGSAHAAKSGGEAPRAGEALLHRGIVTLSAPGLSIPPPNRIHRPFVEFGFAGPRGFSTFSQGFAFGFCSSFGGFPSRHFFGRDFDCFDGGFFVDPFFFGGLFPGLFGLGEVNGAPDAPDSDGSDSAGENATAMEPASSDNGMLGEPRPASPGSPKPKPTILLQLTDGSMYGLTAYRVEGDLLHYTTDYGGENAIPLSRVDFAKTNGLNAERGTSFSVGTDSERH